MGTITLNKIKEEEAVCSILEMLFKGINKKLVVKLFFRVKLISGLAKAKVI